MLISTTRYRRLTIWFMAEVNRPEPNTADSTCVLQLQCLLCKTYTISYCSAAVAIVIHERRKAKKKEISIAVDDIA